MKFEGPAKPMDLPPPPDDGSEPPAIDEERKKEEFAKYDAFATGLKGQVDEIGLKFATYKDYEKKAKNHAQHLWPVPLDPEQERKRKELEAMRKSQ